MDDNITKNRSKYLIINTGKPLIVWPLIFPETILLLKVDHYEGLLNWIKIDRIVNDH